MTKRLATLTAAPLAALALLAAPPAGAIIIFYVDNPFVGKTNIKTCPTLWGDPNDKSRRPALFELVEIATMGDPEEREVAVAADRNLDGFACRFMGNPED